MSTYQDPTSPWGYRLWIHEDDFERRMDELRTSAGERAFSPGAGVDLDMILLESFGVDPDFVELGEGILGKTVFRSDGGIEVTIDKRLAEEAEWDVVARRRLRSTLGHEIGHLVFHRELVEIPRLQATLDFGDETTRTPKVLCRGESIEGSTKKGPSEWWEYQANRGMAALILPKALVAPRVEEAIRERGMEDMYDVIHAGKSEEVVREIMETFDASMQMTFYRLQDLGYLTAPSGQGSFA